ncbi:MAG TPA: hypothetical protein VE999_09295, partial [Gemmataceae bacterium]|nr:hypothetical protein [Gemmataceae bacterium]
MSLAQRNGSANGAQGTVSRGREPVHSAEHSAAQAELNELARELARGFGEKVEEYRKYGDLSLHEARQRAAENSPGRIDRALNAPPDEVSWFDLDALTRKDPALALQRWEQIKEAARNEIRSGYRAALTVQDDCGPWERARFAAVRAELMEAWKPCNAQEQLLVDQLAQWQVLLWRWQDALSTWTTHATFAPRQAKKGESYKTMRLSESEALERAAAMVERLHRLYLRTLKALQDLR